MRKFPCTQLRVTKLRYFPETTKWEIQVQNRPKLMIEAKMSVDCTACVCVVVAAMMKMEMKLR